ncbi:hypothetical protein PR202_gb28414 [Eleusine coracana subsp. coracana]|uniref:CUE domain-containing protein n=1 Tax=Eleusine coracana subsp. coracana TaxID=191504 RepID=A0AAV5FWS3_ELECO|nr:hypothetical protein PR202_gb28414 [Eleusine coracana subsp. coracana]
MDDEGARQRRRAYISRPGFESNPQGYFQDLHGANKFARERTMQGPSQLNPDASPFIPVSMSSFADKAPETQAESSSKGDISGSIWDPLQYEENDMDSVALAKSICSMFPNVSTDFIDELFKANGFDIHLTIDMLHDLNSQDMLHDDAELDFPTFADTTDLHEGQGLPGGDKHFAEVSESSSNLNQALQNEKPATTSDVKSGLPASPKTNPLHNDLGPSNGTKSEGTSVAN